MDLKQRFCKKMYDELEEYKKISMKHSKTEIPENVHKTEAFENLYEILSENADRLSESLLRNLVYQSTGILESLYNDYLGNISSNGLYDEDVSYLDE